GLSPNDYAVVYESDTILGLIPFSWEASKILASNYVGNQSGKWCIAYQKTDSYWNDIVVYEGQAPVYILNYPDEDLEEAEKYAIMFSESDYEIWDQEDNQLHNTKFVINKLGLTTDEINEIWEKAYKLAKEHISNFGEKTDKIVETIFIYEVTKSKDVSSNEYDLYFSIINQKGYEDDVSTIYYTEGNAEVKTGTSFFLSKLGKKLLLGLAEEYDLSTLPDLINNTLIIIYQSDSYSSCLKDFEGSVEEIGDEIPYFDFYSIRNLKDFSSVLFINNSNVSSFDIVEEPLIKKILERNDKRKESYGLIDIDNFTFEWCTYNTLYTMKDAIESIPKLNKFIYEEMGW
ncbi:MAG: hypothetical protein L0Y61_08580, partial [Epsilonproteobacteria bacterium]|nr:hypothetical protein [Campylobacterota bacterium]